MKKLIVASLTLVLLLIGGAADAADSGYKWTGFYAGVNAGGVINNSTYTLIPSGAFSNPPYTSTNSLRTDIGKFKDAAFTGGGQIGYNYQIDPFVLGAEVDFNYNGTDQTDYVNRPLSSPLMGRLIHGVKQKVDFFGTVRVRVGAVPVNRLLLYGTGGLAYGHVESSSNVLFTLAGDNYVGSSSMMRVGWTIGAGAEYAITKNWLVRAEYLYVDLGKQSYSYSDPYYPAYSYTTEIKHREHVIRAGVSYKF